MNRYVSLSAAARRAAWAGLVTTALGSLQIGMTAEQYFAYHRPGLLLDVALGGALVLAGLWQFRRALPSAGGAATPPARDAA